MANKPSTKPQAYITGSAQLVAAMESGWGRKYWKSDFRWTKSERADIEKILAGKGYSKRQVDRFAAALAKEIIFAALCLTAPRPFPRTSAGADAKSLAAAADLLGKALDSLEAVGADGHYEFAWNEPDPENVHGRLWNQMTALLAYYHGHILTAAARCADLPEGRHAPRTFVRWDKEWLAAGVFRAIEDTLGSGPGQPGKPESGDLTATHEVFKFAAETLGLDRNGTWFNYYKAGMKHLESLRAWQRFGS
jgi:hypothetical protein